MIRTTLIATALMLTAGTALAAPMNTAADVQQRLQAAGYTQIHEIEREEGMWEVDVTRADGRFSEVLVDPRTGELFDAHDDRALLSAEQVLAKAASHGLQQVHDLERDGATWTLEARNGQHQAVDVRLSGIDGRILHSEREYWWD